MVTQTVRLNNHCCEKRIYSQAIMRVENLSKCFFLHQQDGASLSVLNNLSFSLNSGECLALTGASGSGKSTLMKCIYGNYISNLGAILVKHDGDWIDLCQLHPRDLLGVRQRTIGYVSQFLRVIPRVPALEVAAEPLLELGINFDLAISQVRQLFYRLNLPESLWNLSPTTFSGGEKQRVNIARALVANHPILLLDEPTSALDTKNSQAVVELLKERKAMGCALIGIFHDKQVQAELCDRELYFGE